MQERQKISRKRTRGVDAVLYGPIKLKKKVSHGITKEGAKSEETVRELLGGFEVAKNKGDIGMPGYTVEVKRKTGNQTRPFHMNVLVLDVREIANFACDFLVFSPVEVMERTLGRRGQHTSDSMICCNVSPSQTDVATNGCNTEDLRATVEVSYKSAIKDPSYEYLKSQVQLRIDLYDHIEKMNAEILNTVRRIKEHVNG